MIFWTVKYTNTQIQIRKYTNTACEKMPEIPNILIFLKSQRYQDIKNDILDCQIHKYTNTKTQMHKYTVTKCRKYPTCVYFQKARDPRISKMILWTIKYTNTQIQVHKYTNTQIQHLRKGQKYPLYAYIFEKPMIQGHQK